MQKSSDPHSGIQGWNSVHREGTGLGEPCAPTPPPAQEQRTAQLTRSRGSDVNLRQQSLSRNFPGALSSFLDEEEKG